MSGLCKQVRGHYTLQGLVGSLPRQQVPRSSIVHCLISGVGESGALRSGVWFRANNLMIMMTQHNFCLLFD